MSKVAIGCAGLLLVGVVGAAGASYFAYHKVTSTVSAFSELGEVEQSIRKQGSYTPPASGEPSAAQVEWILGVQRAVRARLGTRADEIYRRYRRYFEPAAGETAWRGGAVDSALVGLRLSRDVAGLYLDGKRAQVDALNRAGMSLEEYRWTRSRVYAALGVPLMELDIAGIIADVKEGRHPATRALQMTVDTTGSPAVRRLVEPHQKTLEANVGLAFFGL